MRGQLVDLFLHLDTHLSQVIADYGSVDARTREAIALVVGNADECNYCQAAHTLAAIKAGFEQDRTIAIRAGEIDFDDKLAALWSASRSSASVRSGWASTSARS